MGLFPLRLRKTPVAVLSLSVAYSCYPFYSNSHPPIFMIMMMIMTIMTIRTKLFLLNRDTAMVPLLVSAPVQLYRYWPRHINNVNVIISIMIIIFTITELISFRRSARTHPALFLM